MEPISLPGIPHIDQKILDKIDDKSLIELALTDRKVKNLVDDVNADLWKRRIRKNFPDALKYKKDSTYKDYYINLKRYLRSDLSNTQFYAVLKEDPEFDIDDINSARISSALNYMQFEVADYMFSLDFRPYIVYYLLSKSPKTFIWLWDHEIEFTNDSLFDVTFYQNKDNEMMREVMRTLYTEGLEAFKMKNPTGKYEYRARMFQELFTQNMMPALFFIELYDLIDNMIKELDIHLDQSILGEVITSKSKSFEEIREIIEKYNIETHTDMLNWALDAEWVEFFDFATTLTPPLLPDQGVFNSALSLVSYNVVHFEIFKKIVDIMDKNQIEYEYDQEHIDHIIFRLKYRKGYGIHYPADGEPVQIKIDYEGDKQTEVWQWFLERGDVPTFNRIKNILINPLGVQLGFLLLHYVTDDTLNLLLSTTRIPPELLSLYLEYIIYKDIRVNIEVIEERIHFLYQSRSVRSLLAERNMIFFDWLDQIVDKLEGDDKSFIEISDDLIDLNMTALANKISSRLNLPPIGRDIDYDLKINEIIDTDILDDISQVLNREIHPRAFSTNAILVVDKLDYMVDLESYTDLTEKELRELAEDLILLHLTSLAKKIFDRWGLELTDRIYNRWDNVFVIKRKIELFGVLPELSYFEGQMIDMDLESIQKLLESYE